MSDQSAPPIEDDDELDGCDIDFASEADDEETAELRPLYPEGVADDRWDGVEFEEASNAS